MSRLALSKNSGNLIPDDVDPSKYLNFSGIVCQKLSHVQKALECFFLYMDNEVSKFGEGVSYHLTSIESETSKAEGLSPNANGKVDIVTLTGLCKNILEQSSLVEQFAFLGYTGRCM